MTGNSIPMMDAGLTKRDRVTKMRGMDSAMTRIAEPASRIALSASHIVGKMSLIPTPLSLIGTRMSLIPTSVSLFGAQMSLIPARCAYRDARVASPIHSYGYRKGRG